MKEVYIRYPSKEDEKPFVEAMKASISFHRPWVDAPTTEEEFAEFYEKYQLDRHVSYLICDAKDNIVGVINLNEIVLGVFQNAFLGFYVVAEYAGKGYMRQGLKLVMQKAFEELGLHRLEANVQPKNISSISLVRKNGFKKEGYSPHYLKINGTWCDHERWAITFEDWKIQKGLRHE